MANRDGCAVLRFLGDLFDCPSLKPTKPKTYMLVLRVGPVRDRTDITPPNRKGFLMADQITTQQEFDVSISNIKDARGNDAKIDGVPVWETSDDSSLDAEGAATVTVTADGRQGEEVVAITGVLSVVVAPADAVVFDLVAGEVRDRT
jgi:hypothetical protein